MRWYIGPMRVAVVITVSVALLPACKRGKRQHDATPVAPHQVLAKDCAAGVIEACRNLSVLHSNGNSVPRDVDRARALFERACTGGHASACSNLGLVYAEGVGVNKDLARAARLGQRRREPLRIPRLTANHHSAD